MHGTSCLNADTYQTMEPVLCKNISVVIFVYDISSKLDVRVQVDNHVSTFEFSASRSKKKLIATGQPTIKKTHFLLVGVKSDSKIQGVPRI